MIEGRTVRQDLLGLVVFAAVSLCAVSGIFVLKERISARGNYELTSSNALVLGAARVEMLFLRARRTEKDFLLRKDDKYLTRHAGIVKEIFHEMDRLEADLHDHSDSDENTGALRQALEAYAAHFQSLSELNLALGLSPDTGLQGELRSAVHGIEKTLKKLDQPRMQVKMLMMRRHEKDFIMRVDQKYVDRLNARVLEFREFPAATYPSPEVQSSVLALLDTYQKAFTGFAQATIKERETRKHVSATFAEAEPLFVAIKSAINARMASDSIEVAKTERLVLIMSAAAVLTTIIFFALRTIAITRRIARPLQQTAVAIEQLATGTLDVEPPKTSYGEIAQIADAFSVFKQNMLDTQRMEEEQREYERQELERKAEEGRLAREREKEQAAQEQRAREEIRNREHAAATEIASVVDACANGDFSRRLSTADKDGVFAELCNGINQIGDVINDSLNEVKAALTALSKGDLTHRMSGEYSGVFEEICTSVNSTVASQAGIVMRINESSDTIGRATNEIASAARTLAKRTERNAATLEETAAAINELTTSVDSTAGAASEANNQVAGIRAEAERSNSVLDSTVAAMNEIQTSSSEIAKVISLIDDIAFQTNLLALNAGVEAARAGEAGNGFAAVAAEVRNLAARSAEAAKDISSFIEDSRQQVEQGVVLVDQTGTALKSISTGISGIAGRIEAIANSASVQSASVSEINTAIVQLDRSTQQNASLFEDATATSQILQAETDNLAHVIAAFRVGEDETVPQDFNVINLVETGLRPQPVSVSRESGG